MIGVIVDLLRATRRRTGVLVLLGALPVAAAVAGPAYIDAAQRSIVASEVATAKPNETVLSFIPTQQEGELGEVFERVGASEFATPGFDLHYATAFDVAPRDANLAWKLSYRDDVCAHVTLDAGRCPTGRGEVMIGFHSATQLRAGVGDAISFRQSRFDSVEGAPQVVRLGKAAPLSIVGVYRPADPTEAYWGPVPPFPPGLFTDPTVVTSATFSQVGVEPIFTSRATTRLYYKLEVPESQVYDLVADPDQLTLDWVDRYPAELDRMKATAAGIKSTFVAGTDPLMKRIEQSRAAVTSLVPWLAMTVVPLCWFVIFLAAASGAEGRRSELGQVALRGLPLPYRWWLAAGPDAIAVLAGAPLGWLAGQFVGAYAVPGGDVDLSLGSALRRFAAVAVVGAVLAVVLAYRPVVTGRAIDLVRKVTRQVGAWRSVTVDAMVVALAAFAVVEARTVEGPVRGGVATLAPVLVILAGALLVGRLLAPAARRAGRRALSAGRLAGALSGIELSRRSAPRRAVTLAVLGAALLCFTVLAVDAGDAARAQRAGIELGAARVFDVNQVSGGTLRAAVRAADGEGRWAMAAVTIPATGSGPPTVAADTERLATVAWPGSVPAELLSRLRPAVAPSVPVTGNRIQVDVTAVMPTFDPARDTFREGSEPRLRIVVQPPGESERPVTLGDLRLGRHRYTGNLPECGSGLPAGRGGGRAGAGGAPADGARARPATARPGGGRCRCPRRPGALAGHDRGPQHGYRTEADHRSRRGHRRAGTQHRAPAPGGGGRDRGAADPADHLGHRPGDRHGLGGRVARPQRAGTRDRGRRAGRRCPVSAPPACWSTSTISTAPRRWAPAHGRRSGSAPTRPSTPSPGWPRRA